MVVAICPRCRREHKVPAKQGGRVMRCSGCMSLITIPAGKPKGVTVVPPDEKTKQ